MIAHLNRKRPWNVNLEDKIIRASSSFKSCTVDKSMFLKKSTLLFISDKNFSLDDILARTASGENISAFLLRNGLSIVLTTKNVICNDKNYPGPSKERLMYSRSPHTSKQHACHLLCQVTAYHVTNMRDQNIFKSLVYSNPR